MSINITLQFTRSHSPERRKLKTINLQDVILMIVKKLAELNHQVYKTKLPKIRLETTKV